MPCEIRPFLDFASAMGQSVVRDGEITLLGVASEMGAQRRQGNRGNQRLRAPPRDPSKGPCPLHPRQRLGPWNPSVGCGGGWVLPGPEVVRAAPTLHHNQTGG